MRDCMLRYKKLWTFCLNLWGASRPPFKNWASRSRWILKLTDLTNKLIIVSCFDLICMYSHIINSWKCVLSILYKVIQCGKSALSKLRPKIHIWFMSLPVEVLHKLYNWKPVDAPSPHEACWLCYSVMFTLHHIHIEALSWLQTLPYVCETSHGHLARQEQPISTRIPLIDACHPNK